MIIAKKARELSRFRISFTRRPGEHWTALLRLAKVSALYGKIPAQGKMTCNCCKEDKKMGADWQSWKHDVIFNYWFCPECWQRQGPPIPHADQKAQKQAVSLGAK